MSVLGFVVLGCFVALFARLWYLQVMAAPELSIEAAANRTRVVAEEAPRGRILDVKGRVLVDNRTSLVVTVERRAYSELDDAEQTDLVSNLAETLTRFGVPTKIASVERRLADPQYDPVQPAPVAADVPEELEIYLAEHAREFPGVEVRRETVRTYPEGRLAANILGYVGRISGERLETAEPGVDPDTGVEKTYQPSSNIGLAGIEATYEAELRGTPGIEVLEIDADNRPVGQVSYQPPKPGSDIQLNIDIDVQRRSEQALADRLAYWRGKPQSGADLRRNAPAGAAAVVDPQGGAVRALATYPSYDPAEFVGGISQQRYDQLTDVGGVSALVDRSISGQYAPGSTFKLVTADAALTNGVYGPNDWYNDTGVFEIGGQEFTNAGGAVYGSVDMRRALTVSVDTYFYSLGARMDGTTQIQDAAARWGFDAPTGVDLPGESAGFVLTPDEKQALHDQYPDAYPYGEWFTGDNVQLAIGQNVVVVTPLQLANAYAALANGGTIYQPRVAWRVLRSGWNPLETPEPEVLEVIEPSVVRTVDADPEVLRIIEEGLAGVTTDSRGTAVGTFAGFDQGAFPVVGKTGTAEVTFFEDGVEKKRADTSLFAAFGPRGDAKFAAAAVMEESGFGGEGSGVVVRQILELVSGQELTGGDIQTRTTGD
ncbi:penicillin-binding protein 2 [Rhabdothermincola salaria]|uniref:penicillin-binding protein 2 n=1 Tax=Rhabdothermincola salaria TaxID=2903142 RepID=UPI001E3D41DC|nr:penicillin-binding protein 2 [Rhabdothermincola salaria]MCD9623216.1 penicillin-binding protein 2 [Rhabdothermincola salaria]